MPGNFPRCRFARRVSRSRARTRFRLHGDLTLHGVTKPIVLDARYNGGYASHPWSRARASASRREDHSSVGFRRELRHPRSRHHDGHQRRSRGDSRNGVHGTAAAKAAAVIELGAAPFPGNGECPHFRFVGIVRLAAGDPPTFSPAGNCHASCVEAEWCGDGRGQSSLLDASANARAGAGSCCHA